MSDEDPFLGGQIHKSRQFSEHTMEVIDNEVHKILETASKSALQLLKKHQDGLEAVTQGLLEHEELDRKEIADLIGPSVHADRETELTEGLSDAERKSVSSAPDSNGSASTSDEIADSAGSAGSAEATS